MSRVWSRTILLLVLLAGALVSRPARATSAIFLTEPEQAEQSTAVVVATVAAQHVELSKELGRPLTFSRLDVEEVLYGDAPAVVEIEQFGGEYEGMVTHVAGDAHLAVGERCVLFLRYDKGGWYLTAMEQSFYQIHPTSDEALYRVLSSAFFRPDSAGVLRPWDDFSHQSATLAELRDVLTAKAHRPAHAPTPVVEVK